MTTQNESTPHDRENVTEEQNSEPTEKPQTPKEAKETVPGGSALVRSEKHMSDTEIQVIGTSALDENEPEVSISVESTSLSDTAVTLSLTPEEARKLAAKLQEQATHAEQWTAYKREQKNSE